MERKPIEGWPGYFVSRDGRVFGPNGEKAQTPLKRTGHLYVTIYRSGRAHKLYVARLVAAAFIGEIPNGMHVCHGPNGVTDNSVENLRIDTPAGNAADKARDGTLLYGEKAPWAKLSDADCEFIRSCKGLYRGIQFDLADAFGVSQPRISGIINGKFRSGN